MLTETMARWQQQSLLLSRCSHFYSKGLAPLGADRAKIEVVLTLLKKGHTPHDTKARRGAGRYSIHRLDVGLPTTKLLLRLTEQLLVQQIFSVEATFHSQTFVGAV